jgi:hypothetical protein
VQDREQIRDAALKALMSGGISGAVLGAGSKVLGGARSLKDIAKGAGIAGLASGALSGGAALLGSQIMGAPSDDDPHGFTHRGAVGGAVGGSLLGGGLGAAAAGGLVSLPKGKNGNLIFDYFNKLAARPNRARILKGAALGALGLGTVAGYQGSDEGMQVDFLNEEMKRAKRRQMGITE